MGKYDNFFIEHFYSKKGMMGSELNQLLTKTFGITSDNARKLIQRNTAKNIIWSTKPLTFGKGQYFYYWPENKPSREEIKNLLKDTRPPVFRLLQLLDDCSGIISFYEGLKITSSTEENTSSKISLLKDIVNDLAKMKFLVERKDDAGVNFILNRIDDPTCENLYKDKMALHRQNLQTDSIFNSDLMGWLFESNLIATYGAYRANSNYSFGIKHNNVVWDAYAYTKTTGINPTVAVSSTIKEKQTLVVMDIVISRKYSMVDLDGFLARIQINNNSVTESKRKSIPIIFYHTIDDHCLNIAKKLGFLVFSLAKIYGSHIGKLLLDIKSVYKEINENFNKGIEAALYKISVSGQTEKLKGLRGVLFEALLRPLFESIYPNSEFLPNKKLKHPGKEQIREFDYIISSSNPKELIFVELKGYAGKSFLNLGNSETPSTLRYFFRSTVPLGQAYYKEDLIRTDYPIKAVFITTGNYHSECNEFISQMGNCQLVPSRLDKCIYNGEALLELLKKNSFDREIEIIKKYYINVDDEG
ncbi:hypothetical protein [Sphingobacterium siyangense]|jgi:hypothetical protein|uniref:hypothetical protein n=1 Tax=Sphingobacterium siyangense TaxID=459529 RepID=UPI003DA5800C